MKTGKKYGVQVRVQRRIDNTRLADDSFDADRDCDVQIEIGSVDSGRRLGSLLIPAGSLMSAIMGSGDVRGTFEFDKGMLYFGKLRETKEVLLRQTVENRKTPNIPKALRDDGWMYSSGYGSTHRFERRDGKPYYRCLLVRYVDKEETVDE